MSANKISTINVQGVPISISVIGNTDYICLTDIVKGNEGSARAADVIKNWIRSRSTIEFLGTWETIHNHNFKVVEFDHFRLKSGLPTFTMSVSNWIDNTNAIGLIVKSGRNGGTYAHKDIALEFCSSINPLFKIYLIQEFERLKEQESAIGNIEWNVKRIISKANYSLHTDAIKEHIIPFKNPYEKEEWIYANEADMLNLIIFGCTAKQWRDDNAELAKKGQNIRDCASINELAVLSNIESLNATLIKQGIDKKSRYEFLLSTAQDQLNRLRNFSFVQKIEKHPRQLIADEQKSSFNNKLTQALNYNPNKDKRNKNEGNEE